MRRQYARAGFSALELIIFVAAFTVLVIIAGPRLWRSLDGAREPAVIEIVESTPQTVTTGSQEELMIRVMNRKSQPVRDVAVEFLSSSPEDSLLPAQPTTDTSGVAHVRWVIGSDPGRRTVRVLVHGTKLETQIVTEAVTAPELPIEAAEQTPGEEVQEASSEASPSTPAEEESRTPV